MSSVQRSAHRLSAVVASCAASTILLGSSWAHAEPYEIKASWDDNKKVLSPAGADFYFQGLSTTHSNGTIALADNLLLRIADGQPFVTLGIRTSQFESAPSFHDAVSLPDGALLLSTSFPVDGHKSPSGPPRGHLAKRWDGDKIEPFPMPPNRDPEHPWSLPKLENGPDGSVWALANSGTTTPFEDPKLSPDQNTPEAGLFELENGRWKDVPLPYIGAPYLVSDFCVVAPDDVWIIGTRLSIRDDGTITDRSGFAANRSNGDWALFTVPAPDDDPLAWNLERLACRPGSPVYALGRATDDQSNVPKYFFDGRDILYATDGTRWHEQPPPKAISDSKETDTDKRLRISASAVDSKGRLWVTVSQSNGDQGLIASLDNAAWSNHDLPEVPSVDFYAPTRMIFDAQGTGWAIANRPGNAVVPESHGILLRHDGESWKLQGWKWNRLRQRGFGLLGGNLR